MNNETSLDRFHQKVNERITLKQDLKKVLSKRAPPPIVGDVLIFKNPKAMAFQWIVLAADQKESILMVPTDNNPLSGSKDIRVSTESHKFTIRCGYPINKKKFKAGRFLRVGILEGWDLEYALDKTKRISEGKELISSVRQQETDSDPDYKDWMDEVHQGVKALRAEDEAEKWVEQLVSWLVNGKAALKRLINSLTVTSSPWNLGWGFAAAVVLIISIMVVPPLMTPENPINTTSQTIFAQKTGEMENELRDFKFAWERNEVPSMGFSPDVLPSQAEKAFGAGLFTAREALLESREFALSSPLLPPKNQENWSKTAWKSYFELGRWTFLLWTAAQFSDEMPSTFWEKQRDILAQLKKEFVEPQETEAVLLQLEAIEKFLKQGNYDDLGFNLETMMDVLAPSMEDVQ
jgi:hypothetical protein